ALAVYDDFLQAKLPEQIPGQYAQARNVARNNLAWLLLTCPEARLRDPKRALGLIQDKPPLLTPWAPAWTTLGLAHYRLGDFKAAVEALVKAPAYPDPVVRWTVLAMAHWQLGDKAEASRAYDQSLQFLGSSSWLASQSPLRAEELRRFQAEATELGLGK